MSSPTRLPPIQVIGIDEAPQAAGRSPIRPGVFVISVAVGLLALGATAHWATRPPADERLIRAFTAAIDQGDAAEARRVLGDPTIVMWPSYWSILNTEHITPEGDRLDQFIEYHHELQAETILSDCTVRVTPDEELAVALAGAASVDLDHADAPFPVRAVHDAWVRCDYALTNSLAQRLEGPSAVMHGQLSFGLNEGAVRTVFVIRENRSEALTRFRTWLTMNHPDRYEALLDAPSVLAIDVPIMGLVAMSYNADTARTLLGLADEYITGTPEP